MTAPLLEARQVRREFGGGLFERQRLVAVSGASLLLSQDRPVVIAIAGESGSGKTTLARLLLGMVPPTSGSILYEGTDLNDLDRQQRRVFRRQVQAVFQDPFGVFNPFYRVDHTLTMPVAKFFPELSRAQRLERIEEGLRAVGLRAEETLGRYPHELSGGQRQRIMVTRALLLDPKVIVADEPVSMVDASLRATILESLFRIHQERKISLVYITHDLTTAYQLSHTILIMYRGDVVEVGDVDQVIKAPKHPYTQLLVRSIPLADTKRRWGEETDPGGDQGEAETPASTQSVEKPADGRTGAVGCPFADRCPQADDACRASMPDLVNVDPTRTGHLAACFKAGHVS